MKLYVSKPFYAMQVNRYSIEEIKKVLPESFVFFGLNGEGTKEYEEDLSSYLKIGGFYYYNKKTQKIYDNDWIIIRKEEYEIISNDYFIKNFVEVPFT